MLKRIFRITAFLLCIISIKQATAQQKLDRYLDHLFNQKKMMGSVAISFNDSIIYAKSVGYAVFETKTLNNQETKFRIGSLSKTYTAVLVLKAIEEHKLSLDEKLAVYYPEVKNAAKISIEQLLKHRTGIYNFTEIIDKNQWEESFHSEKGFMEYFVNEKSNFEPGSAYEYSNTNYALLGFILQKIYQKSYAEILNEKIVQPLQLKNTYYSLKVDDTKNEALSYNIQNTYLQNQKVNFSNHPASGGITSTPVEVNKFLTALFNGKLLTPANLELMLPKDKGEYGMGIQKLSLKNLDVYEHGGRIENYIADYWYFPKEKLGLVALTNAVNIALDDVMLALTTYAYGKTPELPDFNKINGISLNEFSKIKGTYFKKGKKELVTISSDGNNLVFQDSRSGQIYVSFGYKGKNRFEYEGIKIQFFPTKKELHLRQGNVNKIYHKLPH